MGASPYVGCNTSRPGKIQLPDKIPTLDIDISSATDDPRSTLERKSALETLNFASEARLPGLCAS
jgi:hypothetical protein